MIMSNFIDEIERHAELYGVYTRRQRDLLKIVRPFRYKSVDNDQIIEKLRSQGITNSEIAWLKRTGHILPVYR